MKPSINAEIVLSDSNSRREYGLKVVQGSLQIGTVSQDDTVYVRNVGKRIGDFDEQRSWKGGRGVENLSENPEAFWDVQNGYTLTPGHFHQTLQWYHARGLRSEDMYMPTRNYGDMVFKPLLGDNTYIANSFSASASYSADKGYLWIRRRGSPASSLTFRLMSNSGGSPNTALQTVTKTISDITDYISVYQLFNWTGTEALTSGTTYWVSIHASSADTKDSCWEVACDPDTSSGKTSADGSTWSSASFALYYRITDADINRTWFRFNLRDAFYIVDKKDDGTTASVMYINGDRGMATAGAASTLTDSAKSWTTNRWAGAYVRIIAGTGKGNKPKQIASNTGTVLTITGTWETNPSTDSQYVIYATEWFTQVTFSGGTPSLGTVTGEPVVVNNVAYIPQGTTVFLHMQWNTSTFVHNGFAETATGTKGLADYFVTTNDPADGPVLWRANNNGNTGSGGLVTVSRANLLSAGAFIAWNTALTWKTAIFTGSTSYKITGLGKNNDQIMVGREDGPGTVLNDQYKNIDTGIDKTPDPANARFFLVHGKFMFFPWLNSVVRVYGSSYDDIGDDYRSIGLPDGREGEYSDGETYMKIDLFAIDAGTGVSSVLAWDELGWHEYVRGRQAGDRIRMVKVQTCIGTRNRLWTNMGGDLVFQELPYKKAAPRLDSGAKYMHEAVLESCAIDMGTASAMPKFIRELTATIKNLNTQGRVVYVDYQTDENVHTSNWTYAGTMTQSPESILFLGLEDIRRFAYRLRVCTTDNSTPIDFEGIVPNGVARTPFNLIWTMQIQAGGVLARKGKSVSADDLMRWLLDSARSPGRVKMRSVYSLANNFFVRIHPARMFPYRPRKGRNSEEASFTLVLEEA